MGTQLNFETRFFSNASWDRFSLRISGPFPQEKVILGLKVETFRIGMKHSCQDSFFSV